MNSASDTTTHDPSPSDECPVCHDLRRVDMFTCVETSAGFMEFTQARKVCPRCGEAETAGPPASVDRPSEGRPEPQHDRPAPSDASDGARAE